MRAIVIGAGVIGLTCGVRLLEAGYDVDVVARELPEETTSAVAAAFWFPYLAEPVDRVTAWSDATYRVFRQLAAEEPDSGVRLRWGTELLKGHRDDPPWADLVQGFTRVTSPPAGFTGGWRFKAPVADMGIYLGWLRKRIERAGGRVTRMALPGLPNRAPLVVNCCGLAARSLVGDTSMTPVRGQVVRLSQVGLTEWIADENDEVLPTYVVPRINDIVVGGTAQEGDWNRQPDPATATEMLRRARTLVPELAGAEVLGHRVGLRPVRPTVRLEAEQVGESRVVHCYGHGGSGVTMSWGCADEVVERVRELAPT